MSNERQPEVVVIEATKDPTERIMMNAKDQNVNVNVIYATVDSETSDITYTYDEAGEVEVKAEDMFGLFVAGVVAVLNNTYYAATSCTKAGVITFAFPEAAETEESTM